MLRNYFVEMYFFVDSLNGRALRWCVGLLCFMLCIYVYIDVVVGISASPQWTGVWMVAGVGVGLLPVARSTLGLRQVIVTIILCAGFSGLIVSYQRPDPNNFRRCFQRFYLGIHVGMTQTDVERILHQEFPGVRPKSPHWNGKVIWYALGELDRDFDAEFIEIRISQGRVVRTAYLLD